MPQSIESQISELDGLKRFATVDPEHGHSGYVYLLESTARYVLNVYASIRAGRELRAGTKRAA